MHSFITDVVIMLQISRLRENTEQVVAALVKKNFKNAAQAVEKVIELDQKRKNTQTELDKMLAESKLVSRQIGQLMKAGNKQAAEEAKTKTANLKTRIKELQEVMQQTEQALTLALYDIPNIPHPSVPAGNSDEDNEVVSQHGEIPALAEGALPHWDLIASYDIIDFGLGTKITGAGFPVYKGKGARLQRAMTNYFLDCAVKAGYLEIQPPLMINEDSGIGTGQLPDKEGQMYQLEGTDFYMIPTAEVPITNMYRNEIVKENLLPIKNAGYTPCFRKEAGSWGAHVRGLNRLHQFDKVEIVRIELPENSYAALEEMTKYVGNLLEQLKLPYRVLRLCGGDLGFTSAITYDFEVFSAAQQKWLEVSSVSNFEDYQANRLKLRYKDKSNKTRLLHTLNGSALALPRIIAAILENNQSPEGINIPEVLHPYTGFETITK